MNSDVQKIGILGALAISAGILGAPYFRNFGSPKIRKNGSAPPQPKRRLLDHPFCPSDQSADYRLPKTEEKEEEEEESFHPLIQTKSRSSDYFGSPRLIMHCSSGPIIL